MSLRGTKTLFTDLFIPTFEPAEKQGKGRSESLYNLRNECLIARYYYFSKHKMADMRYDVIIKTLSSEFFLSEVTIPNVLSQNYKHLHELKKLQPSKQYFVKKWPHLVW